MLACIHKSLFEWKSPQKGTFPFKWKVIKGNHLRSNHLKSNYKIFVVVHSIKMVYLSLNKLKKIAKIRRIKAYKSMSEERLLSVLSKSKSVKEIAKNFDDE